MGLICILEIDILRIISNWEIQEENVLTSGEHIYKNDT